jgi:hypothetical protein
MADAAGAAGVPLDAGGAIAGIAGAAANPSIVRFIASGGPGARAGASDCATAGAGVASPGAGTGSVDGADEGGIDGAGPIDCADCAGVKDAGGAGPPGGFTAACSPGEKCIIVRVVGETIPAGVVGTGAGASDFASGVAGTVDAAAAGVSAPHWPQNLARSGSGCPQCAQERGFIDPSKLRAFARS